MARIAWCSDIHLNFISPDATRAFGKQIAALQPDAIAIAGDVADAKTLVDRLETLCAAVAPIPVYYVCGNHDFYHGSTIYTRLGLIPSITAVNAIYLTKAGVVTLTEGVALIGHDGWADGRNGNYWTSGVELNDFRLIGDYRAAPSRDGRLRVMQAMAEEAGEYLAWHLADALNDHDEVVCVTHVPPFAEASFYRGKPSEPDFLPFYSNQIGHRLVAIMAQHPTRHLTILAGHTHGEGEYHAAPNVVVHTAESEYGKPRIAGVLELGTPASHLLAA